MKNLKIIMDKESIKKNILSLKEVFKENLYVKYGESAEFGDDYLTKEEYNKNVDEFLKDFRNSVVDVNKIIENFPKKKDGTFNKRNVRELASCNNCIAIHEWHNTWIYKVVKVYAENDTTLRVILYEKVDTPA